MKFTEKLLRKIVQFFKGSNLDIHPKIQTDGTYYDAKNLSVRAVQGWDYALSDVGGEGLVYGGSDSTMKCIGTFNVNGHLIECFCYHTGTTSAHPARIRIDGLVMVETDKLDWDPNHPLQGDTNERCDGGELFLTDNLNPILIFSIKEIIDCYNSVDPDVHDTYFGSFNLLLYQAILHTAPHHPVFLDLVQEYGNGLYPGKYSYAIRYADSTGNKTSWSVQTPYIPVPAGYSVNSAQHPGVKTYGGSVGLVPNNWGIKIQFRVDNVAGYEYIEIRRVVQWQGQAYGFVPGAYTIKLTTDYQGNPVDILVNKFDIITWQDDGTVQDWVELTDEEDTEEISGYFTCKTLRYFQNRLVPMNITIASKDVSDTDWFIENNGKLGFPVMEKLTTDSDRRGHYKPYNQVYYPTMQSGDYTGWAVYFTDDFGAKSFSVPIDNLAGLNMKQFYSPNRRERLDSDSEEWSVTKWKGAAIAADVNSNLGSSYGYTHEVFDLVGSIQRDNLCTWKNIFNQTLAYKAASKVNGGIFSDCTPGTVVGGYVSSADIGYNPYHPVSDTDEALAPDYDHDFKINTSVRNEFGVGNPTPTITHTSNHDYSPYGFAPNYYSQGVAIWGLKDWPSWARSFSIVRTPPAKRVVCQGIGFYSTYQSNFSGSVNKHTNKFIFWSPDADDLPTGQMHGPVTWTELVDGLNSGGYKVQLVSPLGSFMEVYDGAFESGITGWSRKDYDVDAIVYIRQLYEDGSINPTYGISNVGNGDGYVGFGRWLNSSADTDPDTGSLLAKATVWNSNNGQHVFTATSASQTTEGRGSFLTVELSEDLYGVGIIGHSNGNNFFDVTTTQVAENPQKYCEPFYVVNIIAEDRTVAYGNTTSYVETGHLQKIESKIGIWDSGAYGSSYQFQLVDERWEDCIPNYLYSGVANENRYVYVNNKRWINCTYKSVATQNYILSQLDTLGVYTDPDGNECYGVYMNTGSPGLVTTFYILFQIFNPAYNVDFFIPQDGDEITVKYDNRIPIKVFSGEKTVGESVWCAVDQQQVNGHGNVGTEKWQIGGYPYAAYQMNDRVYILNTTYGTNNIQDINLVYLTYIRQLMINCILETTVNVPLMYGNEFPHVHYVMRPHKWKDNNEGNTADPPTAFLDTDNSIFMGYATDYKNADGTWEWQSPGWTYGGFRFLGSDNIDYGKYLNDRNNTSRPIVGWEEKTRYCTRVKWIQKRNINELDDPNLKSFPVSNTFDISDSYGEIKLAYDNDSEKGNNLIAVTDSGVCLLITDKTLLADVNVNQIAYMVPDAGFLKGEYWINKNIGCSDEFWRGYGEFSNMLFLPNRKGVYKLAGFELMDITEGRDALLLSQLEKIGEGYTTRMTGAYDPKRDEYWLGFSIWEEDGAELNLNHYMHIFCNNEKKQYWAGGTEHDYEDMIFCEKVDQLTKTQIYGVRDYQTYKVGETTTVNGTTRTCEVVFHVCPQVNMNVELVDVFINSNVCPTEVQYSNTFAAMPECSTLAAVMRDYTTGWYMLVPRKTASPNNRLQGDAFFIKVIYSGKSEFIINSVDCGFKQIR